MIQIKKIHFNISHALFAIFPKIIASTFLLFFLISAKQISAKQLDFIVDTDMGIDDVIAIIYLLKQPEINIHAIVINTKGITRKTPAKNNLRKLLNLLSDSSIPFGCGESKEIADKKHQFSHSVLKKNETLANTAIPSNDTPIKERCRSAEELLTKTLRDSKKSIDILAIGPLTNIAKVLQKHPHLKAKIRTIYIMGGAINVPGNIDDPTANGNKTAEWNIYLDPVAANQVFHSGVNIVLVPLDITNKLPLDADFDKSLEQCKSVSGNFIYQLLKNNRKIQPPGIWFFWDPLAAVIATNPEVANYSTVRLSVKLLPDSQAGTTFIDKKNGVPINVISTVNKQNFYHILSKWLCK